MFTQKLLQNHLNIFLQRRE